MSYGIIEYNLDGNPICEICGKSFKRVLSHARQKHKINEKEYKLKFGLDLHKGICSKESHDLSRKRVLDNYEICIASNLVNKGCLNRFKAGGNGRIKSKVSEQTKIRLKKNLKTDKMIAAMKKSGREVGLSGLGNKKRWNYE